MTSKYSKFLSGRLTRHVTVAKLGATGNRAGSFHDQLVQFLHTSYEIRRASHAINERPGLVIRRNRHVPGRLARPDGQNASLDRPENCPDAQATRCLLRANVLVTSESRAAQTG